MRESNWWLLWENRRMNDYSRTPGMWLDEGRLVYAMQWDGSEASAKAICEFVDQVSDMSTGRMWIDKKGNVRLKICPTSTSKDRLWESGDSVRTDADALHDAVEVVSAKEFTRWIEEDDDVVGGHYVTTGLVPSAEQLLMQSAAGGKSGTGESAVDPAGYAIGYIDSGLARVWILEGMGYTKLEYAEAPLRTVQDSKPDKPWELFQLVLMPR